MPSLRMSLGFRARGLSAPPASAPVVAPGDEWHVFLVAGQSNSQGHGRPIDAGDIAGPRNFQWTQAGTLTAANEPLNHTLVVTNNIGHAVCFIRDHYVPAHGSNVTVVLVPAAVPNTSLVGGPWAVGGTHYNTAVTRTNAAMAYLATQSGTALFKGVIWHQGETDHANGVSQVDYAAGLDATIAGFRSEITGATSSVFLLGGTVYAADPVQLAIQDTPNRVTRCGYGSASGLTVNVGDSPHFDAASQRTLAGRYYTAFLAI